MLRCNRAKKDCPLLAIPMAKSPSAICSLKSSYNKTIIRSMVQGYYANMPSILEALDAGFRLLLTQCSEEGTIDNFADKLSFEATGERRRTFSESQIRKKF